MQWGEILREILTTESGKCIAENTETITGLDLHSPFIFRGGQSDTNICTYFLNAPQKKQAAYIDKLSKILEL